MKRTLATIALSFAAGAGVAQATDLLQPDRAAVSPMVDQQMVPAPDHSLQGFRPAQSLAPLVEKLQPAVVNIQVEQRVEQRTVPMHPFFSPFLDAPERQSRPQYRVQTGQGSGFLISADGFLLTNNHVVAHAQKVRVLLANEQEYVGTVVGTDSRIDVALVKIEADEPLPFVQLGVSDTMLVGDWVIAIGNPFGLTHTVTAGIVSAKGRVIGAGPYDDFIQTDASINPGNSGGPLFNLKGEVIGINTAINASGQGIGFAVPMDMVSPFLGDLKTKGRISRGWLGISLQNLDSGLAASLGVDEDAGVLVAEVHEGQPGAKAGLEQGDVISNFGGEQVNTSTALIRAVGRHPAGEKVEVRFTRKGKTRTLAVQLGERPSEEAVRHASFQPRSGAAPETSRAGKLGILPGQPDGRPGVVVRALKTDTPAHGRLMNGDRILKVNGQNIRTPAELEQALAKAGEHAIFVVYRSGSQLWVAVPLH